MLGFPFIFHRENWIKSGSTNEYNNKPNEQFHELSPSNTKKMDEVVKEYLRTSNQSLGPELGSGNFATVYRLKKENSQDSSHPEVIKVIKKKALFNVPKYLKSNPQAGEEVSLKLNHPSILSATELVCKDHNGSQLIHAVVMPEAQNSQNLENWVAKRNGKIGFASILNIAKQLGSAIDYLADNRIAHRDIKPENILIDINQKIKVIDFGISKIMPSLQRSNSIVGTPAYKSPEMVNQNFSLEETDSWAFGVVLYQIAHNELDLEFPQLKNPNNPLPKKFIDLIKGLLEPKSSERLTIKDATKILNEL
jgi:serine/threonine protein kinase